MADMKTGIIYARYSDKKQDDGFSIDAQINAIKEYAISSNIEIKQIFVDQAVSGTSKDRKQLNEALKYCQEHKVHCFLVHKYDRFARNRYDSIIMKKNLSESGTEVVSITQQKTGESSDVLLESLYDGMAEYYSKNLKEEVLKGMVEAASQGYWVGGVAPFGYSIEKKDNKSKLVPNDNSATVKQIYNHYMHDDIGYKNMAKMYKLSVKQITNILKNQKYTGSMVWKKDTDNPIIVENSHPAIVSQEIFNKVQEKIKSKKNVTKKRIKKDYLLTGLLQCPNGSPWTGASAKSGQYFYYRCQNANTTCKDCVCDKKRIKAELVEDEVIDNVRKKFMEKNHLRKIIEAVYTSTQYVLDHTKKNLKNTKIQYKKAKEKYLKLSEKFILADSSDQDMIRPLVQKTKQEYEELEKSVRQLEMNETNITVSDPTKIFIDLLNTNFNPKIVKEYIQNIVIEEGKITVNYKLPALLTKSSTKGTYGRPEGALLEPLFTLEIKVAA